MPYTMQAGLIVSLANGGAEIKKVIIFNNRDDAEQWIIRGMKESLIRLAKTNLGYSEQKNAEDYVMSLSIGEVIDLWQRYQREIKVAYTLIEAELYEKESEK